MDHLALWMLFFTLNKMNGMKGGKQAVIPLIHADCVQTPDVGVKGRDANQMICTSVKNEEE